MSSLTIRELITTWGFSVDDKALKGLDDKLDRLQSSVRWVGGLAVGAAAGLFGLAKATANAGESAADTALKLGLSVEALQEYRYAATLAASSAEEMDTALRFLQKNLADARSGSGEAGNAFRQLSAVLGRDIVRSGKPAEDVLLDVADAIAKTSDAGKRVQLAMQIFGRSGANMIPLLSKGSAEIRRLRNEAHALGAVMSDEATQASGEFNDSLDRAQAAATGLRNTIGVRLMPMIKGLVDRFTAWVVVNRRLLAQRVERAIAVLTDYVERAVTIFARLAKSIDFVVRGMGGWERVARFVTTAMLALMSLRLASYLGQLIMALGRGVLAFRLLGNAGLLAQLKLAAIPVAIGAAFLGLLLIIEDVVAYFQGRKSVTGYMLKNFNELADGLFDKFAEWKERAVAFAKSIAESFTGFLLNLDVGKVGEIIVKALTLALIGSGLAVDLGLAIGVAIFAGIEKAMREKSPMLAKLLFGEDVTKDAKLEAVRAGKAAGKSTEEINADLRRIDEQESQGVGGLIKRGGKSLLGMFGLDLNAEAEKSRALSAVENRMRELQNGAGGFPDVAPSPSPAVVNSTNATSSVTVDAPITVNVPAGTPPEAVAGAARAGVKDSLDTVLRETGRAVAPAVSY